VVLPAGLLPVGGAIGMIAGCGFEAPTSSKTASSLGWSRPWRCALLEGRRGST